MIELRGVNTHNKGAHLMMLAVAQALGSQHPLTLSPNGARYTDRARAGFRQTIILNQAPRVTSTLGDILPRRALSTFGMVPRRSIKGVLDASGFAYSDSFTTERPRREASLAKYWDRHNVPRIYLPQAFGPFSDPDQKKWSTRLLQGATAIFARDRESAAFLNDLNLSTPIHLAPDFTVGLRVDHVPSPIPGRFGAIVPNEKLVTQGKIGEDEYVTALTLAAKEMSASGARPVIVLHEFNDRRIGAAVAERAGCTVFASDDPLVLKRALGDAQVVVASRFHAIVSALSLGTPVAALGWSHKYGQLMTDFGVPDWVISDVRDAPTHVHHLVNASPTDLATLQARITDVKNSNQAMWKTVLDSLDDSAPPAGPLTKATS